VNQVRIVHENTLFFVVRDRTTGHSDLFKKNDNKHKQTNHNEKMVPQNKISKKTQARLVLSIVQF